MTISIEQAQLKLAELVEQASRGERVSIEREGKVVAELTAPASKAASEPAAPKPRRLGFAKDIIKIISDDDEHLKDFEPYMK